MKQNNKRQKNKNRDQMDSLNRKKFLNKMAMATAFVGIASIGGSAMADIKKTSAMMKAPAVKPPMSSPSLKPGGGFIGSTGGYRPVAPPSSIKPPTVKPPVAKPPVAKPPSNNVVKPPSNNVVKPPSNSAGVKPPSNSNNGSKPNIDGTGIKPGNTGNLINKFEGMNGGGKPTAPPKPNMQTQNKPGTTSQSKPPVITQTGGKPSLNGTSSSGSTSGKPSLGGNTTNSGTNGTNNQSSGGGTLTNKPGNTQGNKPGTSGANNQSSGGGTLTNKPGNTQGNKPGTSGTNKPSTSGDISTNKPGNTQGNKPGANGTNKPSTSGDASVNKPGNTQGNKPGTSGTNKPSTSGDVSTNKPGSNNQDGTTPNRGSLKGASSSGKSSSSTYSLEGDDQVNTNKISSTTITNTTNKPGSDKFGKVMGVIGLVSTVAFLGTSIAGILQGEKSLAAQVQLQQDAIKAQEELMNKQKNEEYEKLALQLGGKYDPERGVIILPDGGLLNVVTGIVTYPDGSWVDQNGNLHLPDGSGVIKPDGDIQINGVGTIDKDGNLVLDDGSGYFDPDGNFHASGSINSIKGVSGGVGYGGMYIDSNFGGDTPISQSGNYGAKAYDQSVYDDSLSKASSHQSVEDGVFTPREYDSIVNLIISSKLNEDVAKNMESMGQLTQQQLEVVLELLDTYEKSGKI